MRTRRRTTRRRRRSSSSSTGTVAACIVAAIGLVAVMGVTTLKKRSTRRPARPQTPAPAVRAPQPLRPEPVARPRPAHPLDALAQAVRDAERKTPGIKRIERGPGFEEARVALLAQVSDARDALGRHLDAHPNDDRANRLWDRVLRLYVALKKL